MSNLLAARAQMGTSLAFHIIFAALGVGLPLLLCFVEGLVLRTKNPVWMMLARRWASQPIKFAAMQGAPLRIGGLAAVGMLVR